MKEIIVSYSILEDFIILNSYTERIAIKVEDNDTDGKLVLEIIRYLTKINGRKILLYNFWKI
jgi:hypothetical protein